MAGKADADREELYDSTLTLNNMLDRRDTTCLLFTWCVQRFSKLKKNIFYCKTAVGEKDIWTLKMIKANGTLFVSLSTNVVKRQVYFSIISHSKQRMEGNGTMEIAAGLYVSEFCRKAINNPKNNFLRNDQLNIQCRYDVKPADNRVMVLPYGQNRDSADVFQLCHDLRGLYTSRKYYDWILEANSIRFPVHKQILIARSKVFAELFINQDQNIRNNEMAVNADPRILQEVLLYIYSGELKEMDVEGMLEVYHIAKILKINCLVEKCMNFFQANFTKNNAMKILSTAKLHQDVDLKNAAARFMLQERGNVPRNPQRDEILKQTAEKQQDPCTSTHTY